MPLNPKTGIRHLACLIVLLGAPGCAGLDDPFQREGTWQAENINDINLAAMVADPRHLYQGVGDDATPGALSAAAVHRLLTDKVKPLADSGVGPIQGSATPAASGTSP